MTKWPQKLANNIGRRVQNARGERSLLWLEQRTEQLGHKVGRGAISRLENGRRESITVNEWLVLAAALEVPPVLLLFPDFPYGETDYLPDKQGSAYHASEWLSGRMKFINDGLTRPGVEIVLLVDELEGIEEMVIQRVMRWARDTKKVKAEDEIMSDFIGQMQQRKKEILSEIERLGGVVHDEG